LLRFLTTLFALGFDGNMTTNAFLPDNAIIWKKLATELGCNQSTLQRRFPELAKKIKERYQEHFVIGKEARAKLFRSIVRTSVIDLHNAGIYPSQCRVRMALPKNIDMREPVAQDEWKKTLVEINRVNVRQS
jgi:hypothetical protein